MHDVIVVGSGPAGLSCAASLAQAGIATEVLEQGPVAGAAWRARNDRLRLTTPRRLSSLPGYRLERRYGRWPTARDWSEYLERYASRMALRVRTGWQVEQIHRRACGGWAVTGPAGSLEARNAVVATGEDRVARMPDVDGLATFRGRLLHAADFEAPSDFRGQRVLVVGAGTSGTEVATWLAAEPSVAVFLSVRSSPVLLPRQVCGVPTSLLGLVAERAPDAVIDAVGDLVARAAFGREACLPALERHRLSERRYHRYAPSIGDGLARALRADRVTLVPGLEGLQGQVAVLSDGTRLAVEAVVAATGYEPRLEELVGELGVLSIDGRPLPHERLAVLAPGLYFVGLRARVAPLLAAGRREGARVAADIVHRRQSAWS